MNIDKLILFSIVLGGFIYRLRGIIDNHSFWTDEAFMAHLGQYLFSGKINPFSALQWAHYEPLHIVQTGLFMRFFGDSEFAARLPVVIVSSLGIFFAYLLAKRLSNEPGGLLAAFLYAFSLINLSHATQAKPYATLQTIFLIILYLLSTLEGSEKRNFLVRIALILILSILSFSLHYLGAIIFIPVFFYCIFYLRNRAIGFLKKNNYLLRLAAISIVVLGLFAVASLFREFLARSHSNILISYNHITYFRELFWRNYAFITLPAVIGYVMAFKKQRRLLLVLTPALIFYLYLWIFKQSTTNIRYLVPFFGILFVLFGVFWGMVGHAFFRGKEWIICLVVLGMIYGGGYKIARSPSSYYSPNTDFYGDVQIADYKNFYLQLDRKFGKTNIPVFNNWYDAQTWYWPEKKITGYFMIGSGKGDINPIDQKPVYHELDDLLHIIKKYPSGIIIVEDWESIMPEEIKEYAKKNLHLEVRVEGLPQARGDNWPLAAYSWGLD